MKNKYIRYIFLLLSIALFACQSDDELIDKNIGYLRLNLDTYVSAIPTTKVLADYNPKRLAVKIKNATGEIVKETDDYDHWDLNGQTIPLKVGKYTITASSFGFDGEESGFDIPYYYGSTEVNVTKGKNVTAEITCTLANVKVSVNFDESFKKYFSSAAVQISSSKKGIIPVNFEMGTESVTKAAYFPVGNLTSDLTVVNKSSSVTHTQKNEFATEVQARDHYILNFKVADTGKGGISVSADDQMKTYTYIFEVARKSDTRLGVDRINAWSTFAELKGSILSTAGGVTLDPANIKFEYQQKGVQEWTSIDAVKGTDDKFSAKVTGLQSSTEYSYRLIYRSAGEEYISDVVNFTTESMLGLPNGNLDDWYKNGKIWYPNKQGQSFWDSSNPGSGKYNNNVTNQEKVNVHTSGVEASSAKLESKFVVIKFAAASLYTGAFNKLNGTNGAIIDFGRPFTNRPTQLKGWYQYIAKQIDNVGKGQPSNTVKAGDTDLWSAYIVLTTGTYTLDNTHMENAKDFNALLKDPNDKFVVAYGALPDAECVASSAWKGFNIDLTYKNLDTKPTHIIIVFSSSKYGDYFTGGVGSTLYLDDLELVYGDNPKVVGQ